jgi:hypothetical protein
MEYAVRFANGGIVMPKLFAWLDEPAVDTVQLFSDKTAVVPFMGEERARFIRYIAQRSEDSEDLRPTMQAAEPIGEPGPRPAVRSAP